MAFNPTIPDTNNIEVAKIAAAMNLAFSAVPVGATADDMFSQYLEWFEKAYKAVSNTYQEHRPTAKVRSL